MKKTTRVLLILILVISLLPARSTNASGTLSCWYSDEYRIGRWNSNYLNVFKCRLSLNDSPYFLDGMSHACSQWSCVLPLTISSSTSNNSAPIRYYSGTLSLINSVFGYTIPSDYNGYSDLHYDYTDSWYLGSLVYTGVTLYDVNGCIIDKGRTQNQTKKTCTHELGHALGWIGHSGTSSDIMYFCGSSNIYLSNRDRQHLLQIY